MVSVPPEVAANAAFQAAPSWLTRPDASPANDIFRSLVHQNTPSDQPPPPSPPPPQNHADGSPPPAHHNNPHAATPPTAHHNNPRANDNAAAANSNDNYNASGPRPTSNNSNSGSNDGPSASAGSNSNAGGSAITDGNNNGNGASANGASPSATTSSPTATSGNSTSGQGDATNTAATAVDASLLAQQVGNAPVTPTPVAVAIPTSQPIISTPSAPPSSGGPSAPLAIAAAAIAASSQAIAGSPGASAQAKSVSDATATGASTTATTKTIPSSQAGVAKVGTEIALQANGADPLTVTTAALTGTVAGSAPLAPKAQGKTAATTQTTGSTTTNSASIDSASTLTTTPAGQNAGVAQASNAGKPETPAAGTEPTSGAAADATAPAQPVAAHDHAATTSVHVSADLPDPGAQGVASLQPQLNPASSLGQASNLTATAAANGPVPISGVALQIAINVKNGKSNFEIRLDPPELGRIDVRVQIDQNGQVTSHLTVEKAETLSMLQQDAPALQQALNDAGLKSGSGGLQFSLRDQSSFGQNSGSGSNPNAHQLIISEEDAVPATIAGLSYGRSPGSGGGLDIRV